MNTENMAEGLSGREAHDGEAERAGVIYFDCKTNGYFIVILCSCCMCMVVWQISKYI